MRFKFFLCASADFGVRFSNVEISFSSAGYIECLREAQAVFVRPLDWPDGSRRPAAKLEVKLQSKLHQARRACADDASEIRSVGNVAVRIEKLGMVSNIEYIPAEFDPLIFADFSGFL